MGRPRKAAAAEGAQLAPGQEKIVRTEVREKDHEAEHPYFPGIPYPDRVTLKKITPALDKGTKGTIGAALITEEFIGSTWGDGVYTLQPLDAYGKRVGPERSLEVDGWGLGREKGKGGAAVPPGDYMAPPPGMDPENFALWTEQQEVLARRAREEEEARQRRFQLDEEARQRREEEQDKRRARWLAEEEERKESAHKRDLERVAAQHAAELARIDAQAQREQARWQQQLEQQQQQAEAMLAREQERNQAFLRVMQESSRSTTEILIKSMEARGDSNAAERMVGMFSQGLTLAGELGGGTEGKAMDAVNEGLRTLGKLAERGQVPNGQAPISASPRRAVPHPVQGVRPGGQKAAQKAAALAGAAPARAIPAPQQNPAAAPPPRAPAPAQAPTPTDTSALPPVGEIPAPAETDEEYEARAAALEALPEDQLFARLQAALASQGVGLKDVVVDLLAGDMVIVHHSNLPNGPAPAPAPDPSADGGAPQREQPAGNGVATGGAVE